MTLLEIQRVARFLRRKGWTQKKLRHLVNIHHEELDGFTKRAQSEADRITADIVWHEKMRIEIRDGILVIMLCILTPADHEHLMSMDPNKPWADCLSKSRIYDSPVGHEEVYAVKNLILNIQK